jgi:pimeloyl-ACP methyl ester carboxylesterase
VSTETVTYPGAQPPDRRRAVDSHGLRIEVYEWGDPDAPPLALAHGGFDFARTFDVFAPLLAAGGWRVVSWDQRGHGASEHAAMYSWSGDLRDALAVIDSVTTGSLPVVGHSKGGSVMVQFAAALPHRVTALVNLDGVPSRRAMPDVPDHERTKLLADELGGWLDFRRGVATKVRRPDTLDGLAERRAKMNPRLPIDWLRYLVSVGARHDEDGWRWRIDPGLRFGGFGPWRPEWAMARLPGLNMPMLAVLATEPETLGWATPAEEVEPFLPPDGRLVSFDGVGHFVHIEHPQRVADLALEFLDGHGRPAHPPAAGDAPAAPATAPAVPGVVDQSTPGTAAPATTGAVTEDVTAAAAGAVGATAPTVTVRHSRIELALHRLSDGEGRPLLHLHGLGEWSPAEVPARLADWPGTVWALDFTGHGASTRPTGGGYYIELLMSDVDAALAHIGEATLYGRGLGAYVALLTAGGRPSLVRGAVLDDGAGMTGGGPEPGGTFVLSAPLAADDGPDPYALLELSQDIRPTDYAATYARQAATLSGLDVALAVTAVVRPPWLAAVASEPGVETTTLPKALALFASA